MDIKIIAKTTHGIVSKYPTSNMYEVLFKNLSFRFSHQGYNQFTNYIYKLKEAFDDHYACSNCQCSEITIPTAGESLQIVLSYKELMELCDLFTLKNYKNFNLDIKDRIDFTFSLN